MRYQSSGGGNFAKFDTVGVSYEGTFLGTRQAPNKFKGTVDTIVDLMGADGQKLSVRLDKKDLQENWAIIDPRPQAGERIRFTFEGTYPSKMGQPGKRIPIDMPDRPDTGDDASPAAGGDTVEEAYAVVVKAKGEAAAKAIRAAVENVAKGDLAKQAELLRNAVAA